jgi:uncharacterized ferritin-like protein (DUF455 family)
MELREFATQLLLSPTLEDKLRPGETPLTDADAGPAQRIVRPTRPPSLQFAARRTAPEMPRGSALRDPAKRAVAHHIMANHELQALEVMAWVLLTFPDAPRDFRLGLAGVMADEQRHTRMHVERAHALELEFGDLPVNSYIWMKAMRFECVLDYLAGVPLLFEGRNLDHTLEFAAEFTAAGDERGAAVLKAIHRDEVRHVAFGIEWLRRLKPQGISDWDAFESHLHWPLRPEKARGAVFQRDARRAAGLSEEFIERLERTDDESADGRHT